MRINLNILFDLDSFISISHLNHYTKIKKESHTHPIHTTESIAVFVARNEFDFFWLCFVFHRTGSRSLLDQQCQTAQRQCGEDQQRSDCAHDQWSDVRSAQEVHHIHHDQHTGCQLRFLHRFQLCKAKKSIWSAKSRRRQNWPSNWH